MERIFEANAYPLPRQDFADEAEARRFVEANTNDGTVVTFVRDFDGRDRSCAMWRWKAGSWNQCNIF